MRVEKYMEGMVKAAYHRVVYTSEDEISKRPTNNRNSMMELSIYWLLRQLGKIKYSKNI